MCRDWGELQALLVHHQRCRLSLLQKVLYHQRRWSTTLLRKLPSLSGPMTVPSVCFKSS